MSNMYNLAHYVMDEEGLLEKLDSPQWMKMDGDVVETRKEDFCKRDTHRMKHPDHQVFVDEGGNNINIKDDGNVGGEKLLKRKRGKAKITAATNDSHFTVLGFTLGTGAPPPSCVPLYFCK